MTFTDSQLSAMLAESERLPEVIRDDEFWRSLESMSPEAQTLAISNRFMALTRDEQSELHVELYAMIAAGIAEMVRRHGPVNARLRLRPKVH